MQRHFATLHAHMSKLISVDVWFDFACPWCYIGKRKFEQGVVQSGLGDQLAVTYHSYEVAPDTPADFDGSEADFLAGHKGIGPAQVAQMFTQVTAIAAGVGLDYDFDILRHANTRKAHELLHFAKQDGKQQELAERLFAAYFTQGRYLGSVDELTSLAAEVGLDADAARQALESGEFSEAVSADLAEAQAYGVNGVPFYVFDGRYGVSGAQPAEVFAEALTKVAHGHQG